MNPDKLYDLADKQGKEFSGKTTPFPFKYRAYENPVFVGADVFNGETLTRPMKECVEPEGACGFGFIVLDNHGFFTDWLKSLNKGNVSECGRYYEIRDNISDQSIDRKIAYCLGFMHVLIQNGVFAQIRAMPD